MKKQNDLNVKNWKDKKQWDLWEMWFTQNTLSDHESLRIYEFALAVEKQTRREVIYAVRKALAVEGVLYYSVEKALQEILDNIEEEHP